MIYIYIKRTLERIARVFHPGCFPTKKNNSNSHPRLSSTEEKQMQAIQLSQFSCLEKKPMDPNSRYVCIVSIATKIGSPHLWDTEFYNNKKHNIYIYRTIELQNSRCFSDVIFFLEKKGRQLCRCLTPQTHLVNWSLPLMIRNAWICLAEKSNQKWTEKPMDDIWMIYASTT